MATTNTFLTPKIIAKEALMVLRNNAVMSNLVYRDYSDDFVGAVGDAITVRTPAKFVANEFDGSKITVQDAKEVGVEVKMDKLLDVSFKVTSQDLTMKIEDFSQQLLVPAMQAFANKIDSYLLNAAKTAATSQKVTSAAETAVTKENIVDARQFLTKNAAPLTDRHFVYNTKTEADLLKTDLFVSAEKVGDEGTALREASLGRKYGMDFYVDQNVDAIPDLKAIAFHKNGLALVTRMLEQPKGAANSATVSYDGFGLRVVYDYDINTKTDVVSIDMLCGVTTLDSKLIAEIAK